MDSIIENLLTVQNATENLQAWLAAEGRPKVETIHYASDGWAIEAILVLPPSWTRTEPLPTLVYLHGGPENRNELTLQDLASARGQSAALFLAQCGYAVFLPNFRGSSGYGQAFMDELKDYQLMKKPFRDVMAGVDVLIDLGIADPGKLGLYGSSYGAQLVAWATAHSDRFKASVLALGRYDPLVLDRCRGQSFHSLKSNRQGNSDALDMWLKPEVYAELSPLHHVTAIHTPALIIETGAERKDLQARMLFNALQSLEVESYWVCYQSAFHNGQWSDLYKRDYMMRLLAWWDHHLKGKPLPVTFEHKQLVLD